MIKSYLARLFHFVSFDRLFVSPISYGSAQLLITNISPKY